jgi:hypothetical protein
MQARILFVLLVLSMPLHYATAATAAVVDNPQGPMGLRISNVEVIDSGSSVVVDAGISRSRLTRVLTPVRLEINLVNAEGTVAASEVRVVSAADFVRLNSSDRHVQVAFNNLPAAANYKVSLQWL